MEGSWWVSRGMPQAAPGHVKLASPELYTGNSSLTLGHSTGQHWSSTCVVGLCSTRSSLDPITSQHKGAPSRPKYHPEERETGIQAGAVGSHGVLALGSPVYRKGAWCAARVCSPP